MSGTENAFQVVRIFILVIRIEPKTGIEFAAEFPYVNIFPIFVNQFPHEFLPVVIGMLSRNKPDG